MVSRSSQWSWSSLHVNNWVAGAGPKGSPGFRPPGLPFGPAPATPHWHTVPLPSPWPTGRGAAGRFAPLQLADLDEVAERFVQLPPLLVNQGPPVVGIRQL